MYLCLFCHRPADSADHFKQCQRLTRENQRVTDAAIARAGAAAPGDWKDTALYEIQRVAREWATFTTDEVWKRVGHPPEPRALGSVMRQARLNGWIESTDDFVCSTRGSRHRAPMRVWKSLIVVPWTERHGEQEVSHGDDSRSKGV